MPSDDMQFFEAAKAAMEKPAPRISDDGIAYYKSLLANPTWCADNPSQAAFLRASVDIGSGDDGAEPTTAC